MKSAEDKDQDVRRENLRKWVLEHGVPPKEKSYFSQLLSGSSPFGEKAARRLEADYKMGERYLDAGDVPRQLRIVATSERPPRSTEDTDSFVELVALYQQCDPDTRRFILQSARDLAKAFPAQWTRVGTHKS